MTIMNNDMYARIGTPKPADALAPPAIPPGPNTGPSPTGTVVRQQTPGIVNTGIAPAAAAAPARADTSSLHGAPPAPAPVVAPKVVEGQKPPTAAPVTPVVRDTRTPVVAAALHGAPPAPAPVTTPAASGTPQALQVGSDATAPGVYPAPTMTFARLSDSMGNGAPPGTFASPKSGPLAGLNDDQLFSLIAYGTDPAMKTAAMNAAWTALGGNTGNYNAWINSFDGPKQVSLSSTDVVQAAMAAAGANTGGAGGAGGVPATPPGGWNATNGGVPQAGGGFGPPATGGGGIVNTGTGGGGTDQFAPPGTEYNPVMGTVQGDQTVQGQLSGILKNGSPLLEAAKARAMQAANARGLQNTSMATQSGEEAIVNTALPIAQQDAQTYQKQALVNQDITNQFLSMKEGASLDLTKAYEAFKQSNFEFDKDQALKKYINDSGNTTQEKVAALQAATSRSNAQLAAETSLKTTLMSTEAQLKAQGMQIDANALLEGAKLDAQQKYNAAALSQNAMGQYLTGLNNIQLAQLEPDAKQAALNNWNAPWVGNPYLPFNVTLPPTTTTTAGG